MNIKRFTRICKKCGKSFVTKTARQVYCNDPCDGKYLKKQGEKRNCKTCGKEFIAQYPYQAYCQKPCGYSGPEKTFSHLSPDRSKAGVLSEMFVVIDLLKKGYEVFRSITLQSKFDIVAFGNGKLFKVEVKTAHLNPSTSKVVIPPHPHQDHDILALYVVETGEIIYINPELGGRIELAEFEAERPL